jgi:hypothetical protein
MKSIGMWWEERVARTEMRDAYIFFIGIPKDKRQAGRLRRIWKDNIKLETEFEDLDCFYLAQNRIQCPPLFNTVMNALFHKKRRISCQLNDYQLIMTDSAP